MRSDSNQGNFLTASIGALEVGTTTASTVAVSVNNTVRWLWNTSGHSVLT